jgi:hypothetical protein
MAAWFIVGVSFGCMLGFMIFTVIDVVAIKFRRVALRWIRNKWRS